MKDGLGVADNPGAIEVNVWVGACVAAALTIGVEVGNNSWVGRKMTWSGGLNLNFICAIRLSILQDSLE